MLGGLRKSLASAINRLNEASINLNEEAIHIFVTEIANALVEADIAVDLVTQMKNRITERSQSLLNNQRRFTRSHIKNAITKVRLPSNYSPTLQCLIEELTAILTAPVEPYKPVKRKRNVVMFVGLQGAGKTTTVAKYALHYKNKGFRPGIICADTFRAGAYHQLAQNAQKCKIPFYGDERLLDSAMIAHNGVTWAERQNLDLIIIDTSGRHKQEENLFNEMMELQRVTQPEACIYVIDSHIGQSCYDQAKAFRQAVPTMSAIILTKFDSTVKGGGAITGVVATGCPITFIGTGEGFYDFEPFEAYSFVARLLDLKQDPRKLLAELEDQLDRRPVDRKKAIKRITKGGMTYTDLKDQLSMMSNLSNVTNLINMVPGMSSLMGGMNKEMLASGLSELKVCLAIIDSMTLEERECAVALDEKRKLRLAKGAGCHPAYVDILINLHQGLSKTFAKMGKTAAKAKRMR